MELFASLGLGLQTALAPAVLVYALAGVVLGQIVGVLPGVGALTAISLLLPVTFYLDPTQSLVMLAGIYYGSQYGGSIASILLRVPGTPASVVTTFDGYPMTRNGRAGAALFLASVASLFGSVVGVLLLTAGALPLAHFALQFGAPDYFALVLMGLVGASIVSAGSARRAVAMVLFGLLLGTVGTDVNTGAYRFVLVPEMADGISLVAVAMGLFGVSEVIASVGRTGPAGGQGLKLGFRDILPRRDEMAGFTGAAARGSAVGSAFGALPGTGAAIAAFVAYALEKRISRNPGSFGAGQPRGVVAPESANNAAAITGFIPTLTLGIPGDSVMALMLGAMIINGIVPGPAVVTDHPTLFWGVIASFIIGNVILVLINLPLLRLWVRLLSIPYWALYPAVLVFVSVGVYSFRNSVTDVYVTLIFAAIGTIMTRLNYPSAPLLLGFILGPMLEEYLRRSMLLYDGDMTVFVTRPLSATFMAVTAVLALSPVLGRIARLRARRRERISGG